ncbi:PREDICTED: uncharacterized protein LOC106111008 [Papilio polytes]|uniref:uncharacterized protein LOC106111008 n=1 Tax=Papilio polytes TaxID=76194 RepID=UPI0006768B90|nr:PREDICTED: uncharacterized protein LOC106111008 [Papilio polytes]
MLRKTIFTICLFCVSAQALASSDDKFIKKYAMMKIYESCFGPEVVKQIREEMKDAYAKCSLPPSFEETPNPPQMSSVLLGKLPPGFSMDPSTQTITKPTDGASLNQDNDLSNIDMKPQKQTPMAGVLSFRPLTPNFQQQAIPQAGIPPYMMQNPQFRPFSPAASFFQTPYTTALKTDIQDGLQFCQKFSQCVPEIKRDVAPLSQELIKPMFFFRCYKHKKLEACIMKDIRERFTSEDELDSESDFRFISRSARSVRDDALPDPRFEALDEMAAYFYDYLSGSTGMDYDLYL